MFFLVNVSDYYIINQEGTLQCCVLSILEIRFGLVKVGKYIESWYILYDFYMWSLIIANTLLMSKALQSKEIVTAFGWKVLRLSQLCIIIPRREIG